MAISQFVSECDDRAETDLLRLAQLDLTQADGDSRDIARAEARNPSAGAPVSEWAGCPFHGDEAFNLSSASGYIRARALVVRDLDSRAALLLMADKLAQTAKKVRARVSVEAEMREAQRTNEAPV